MCSWAIGFESAGNEILKIYAGSMTNVDLLPMWPYSLCTHCVDLLPVWTYSQWGPIPSVDLLPVWTYSRMWAYSLCAPTPHVDLLPSWTYSLWGPTSYVDLLPVFHCHRSLAQYLGVYRKTGMDFSLCL